MTGEVGYRAGESAPGSVLRTAVPRRGLEEWVPKCTSRRARLSCSGPHFTTFVMEEGWIMMGLVKANETEQRKRALWVEGSVHTFREVV